MHIFKYSVREGTKAAVMPDQVPEQKKTERSNILLSLEKKMSEEFRRIPFWDFFERRNRFMKQKTACLGLFSAVAIILGYVGITGAGFCWDSGD